MLESLDSNQDAAVEDADSLDETKFEDKAFDFDLKDLDDDKDKRRGNYKYVCEKLDQTKPLH